MRICITATVPVAIRTFMAAHIRHLSKTHEILLCAHGEPALVADLLEHPMVSYTDTPIERKISLLRDLHALLFLWRHYRKNRPELVFSVMPKAGLLAMLAARLARIPTRMHIFTGQVWATKTGLARAILKRADKMIAHSATHILTDSPSQREFLIQEGIVSPGKITVLANGSICGVDPAVFHPDNEARIRLRDELKIPQDAIVYLYLGRLNRDKGISELARAFARLADRHPDTWLVMVGLDEENLTPEIETTCARCISRVRLPGFTPVPQYFMALSDIFCLPSHREGFGSVIIEAAACLVPTIASRIYGITDAVIEEQTGLLFPAGDEDALLAHMITMRENHTLRNQLANAASARALQEFSSNLVTQAMVNYVEQAITSQVS